MESNLIKVNCRHCGKTLSVKNPGKPGVFKVACPHCQQAMQVQLNPRPLQMAAQPAATQQTQQTQQAQQSQPAQQSQQPAKVPLLTDIVAEKSGKGYVVRTLVNPNQPYALRCAKCGSPVLFKLTEPGVKGVRCRKCTSLFYVKCVDPQAAKPATPQQPKQQQQQQQEQQQEQQAPVGTLRAKKSTGTPAMLTWGNIFNRQKRSLMPGTYTIGRKDSEEHSDIEINDKFISRRSAVLEVQHRDNAYFFKFTVKHATNPVLHNNKPLAENESVYLRYDDTLQLGRTLVNFKKQK